MATLANIVVKKADGTTDVTYVAKRPASGSEPAVFRNEAVGTSLSQQPEFRVRARDLIRKKEPLSLVTGSYKWMRAVTNPSTGQVDLFDGVTVTISVEASKKLDAAARKEAVHQALNLAGSTSFKAAADEGASYY